MRTAVNMERLMESLHRTGDIGKTENGGITRPGFSREYEMASKELILSLIHISLKSSIVILLYQNGPAVIKSGSGLEAFMSLRMSALILAPSTTGLKGFPI